jgi:hypothetical protein
MQVVDGALVYRENVASALSQLEREHSQAGSDTRHRILRHAEDGAHAWSPFLRGSACYSPRNSI